MRTVLEPKPLLVAAAAGAVGYFIISRRHWSDLAKGAALGALVQVAVRVARVS